MDEATALLSARAAKTIHRRGLRTGLVLGLLLGLALALAVYIAMHRY
jgi:hypothetical protein